MSFQTAYKAYQTGDFTRAETSLSAHLTQHPNDAMGLHLGALIAQAQRDYRTAFDRIQRSLRDATNRHEKYNTMGNILRAVGDDVAAADAFKAALLDRPHYETAQLNLARLMFETARHSEAADQYAAVTKSNPSNQLAWRGYANALLEEQKLDAVEALLKDSPLSNAETAGLSARVAFYRGDSDGALETLRNQISDPSSGQDSFALALQILHVSGQWETAKDLIDLTLSRHSDREDLWGCAIRALNQAGDVEGAQAALSRAPKGLAVDLVKIEMMISGSRFEDAEAEALQALRQMPENGPLMKRLCKAALGNHSFDLAQNVADLGLMTSPNDQFYYAIKATAGRAKGQDYRYYFDYDRFVKPYDLDPPAGWADIASFNADLAVALTELHSAHGAPLDQTLRLGTQTAPNLKYVDSPVIRAFFSAVDPAIRNYLKTIKRDPRHAFLRRNVGGYHIRSAWSVRLGDGGHHVNHIHPEGWISSAYYVDVPKGEGKEGWIKFGEPPAPLKSALNQGPEHDVEPVAGRLVLFPSYLWHGTYPLKGDASRLTLPIDILPDRP